MTLYIGVLIMKIFITYCSAKKNDPLRGTGKAVTPGELYVSGRVQGFIKKCEQAGVKWAVLSDLYGVWLPDERHQWYDKSPDEVSEEQYRGLLADFDQKLERYDQILFFYQPDSLHSLHRRLLQETCLKDRVAMFSDLRRIVNADYADC